MTKREWVLMWARAVTQYQEYRAEAAKAKAIIDSMYVTAREFRALWALD